MIAFLTHDFKDRAHHCQLGCNNSQHCWANNVGIWSASWEATQPLRLCKLHGGHILLLSWRFVFRKVEERLVMNRKGPWEGYRRQAKPVVSFPPSFARTFSSRERRLGTRQRRPCEMRVRGSDIVGGAAKQIQHCSEIVIIKKLIMSWCDKHILHNTFRSLTFWEISGWLLRFKGLTGARIVLNMWIFCGECVADVSLKLTKFYFTKRL